MMKLTVEHQDEALRWASLIAGGDGAWPPGSHACAVIDDETEHYIAVAVFNHFYGTTAAVHIAADPKSRRRWATPNILSQLFGYAFYVLKLSRLSGYTPSRNRDALQLAYRLGFVPEGRQRNAAPDGDDLMLTGMLREECPWLAQGIFEDGR